MYNGCFANDFNSLITDALCEREMLIAKWQKEDNDATFIVNRILCFHICTIFNIMYFPMHFFVVEVKWALIFILMIMYVRS